MGVGNLRGRCKRDGSRGRGVVLRGDAQQASKQTVYGGLQNAFRRRTAIGDTDYTVTLGALTFEIGDSSKTIEVLVLTDDLVEGDETLTLKLSNHTYGQLIDDEATGTIHDAQSQTSLAQAEEPEPDTDSPSVTLTVPSDVQNGAFDVSITFTEPVSDFLQDDLSVTGTAGAFITAWAALTDKTTYTAKITPTNSGEVVLSVPADVATDAAGNPNTAAPHKPLQ